MNSLSAVLLRRIEADDKKRILLQGFAYLCVPPVKTRWVMKYKKFSINVFERKPEKWRAQITRMNGRRLKSTKELGQLATSVDHSSAVEAMTKAMEIIDAVSFSRNIEHTTERHWRCLSKADRKTEAVTGGLS
jgi:hypothetical protein